MQSYGKSRLKAISTVEVAADPGGVVKSASMQIHTKLEMSCCTREGLPQVRSQDVARPPSSAAAEGFHPRVPAHSPGCNMLGTFPKVMDIQKCPCAPEGCGSGGEPKAGAAAVGSLTSLSRLVSER